MQIHLLLFASIRETAGASRLTLQVDSGSNAAVVLDELRRRFPDRSALLERCALAVNEEYESPDVTLHDGDTVAVIPPVSGGEQNERTLS